MKDTSDMSEVITRFYLEILFRYDEVVNLFNLKQVLYKKKLIRLWILRMT